MGLNALVAFAAALLSSALAIAVLLRKRHSLANWCFVAGMTMFAVESVLHGISFETFEAEKIAFWQTLALATKSLLPGTWLCFSLTYSRGNYREFLARSRLLLAATFLVPIGLFIGARADLLQVYPFTTLEGGWWVGFSPAGKVLNGLLLGVTVLILMNLERTFRSAVGTMQWRIKFFVLGLGIIFGARIYTKTQVLLFSGHSLDLVSVETGALLIGCILMVLAYFRSGFSEIDVYPSRAVLHTSVTVLLVGGYLFLVGVLAQIVARTGGVQSFQIQAFLVLLAIVGLAVLLLSSRLRQTVRQFVSRHFKRPQHEVREIWTRFTQRLSVVLNQSDLCSAAAKLISGTFNALSVTIWLLDEEKEQLVFAASTSQSEREAMAVTGAHAGPLAPSANGFPLRTLSQPFDLEKAKEDWAASLREISSPQFRTGGNRLCVPLMAGDYWLGVAILADRVGGVPYTVEELDLLKCIGGQVAAGLLNLQLTAEVMQGKELEAFQAISAFFVHDLKNVASTLSLMLQNLPVHFDDPAFRKDALRGIGETVTRINNLIGRLSALRHKLDLRPAELDLNLLVNEVLENLNGLPEVEFVKELGLVPKLVADRDQLRSVITNLLLNARDAVGAQGRITVETREHDGWADFLVTDNGCGMSPAFIKDSLFRPFHTTKKKGLGIGMFQSKMVVEAHRGRIQVKSELGTGTTFRVLLPLKFRAE